MLNACCPSQEIASCLICRNWKPGLERCGHYRLQERHGAIAFFALIDDYRNR
jgi:hypothetical protein